VVGDVPHVGREERLVPLVRARSDVRPPEEGLRHIGAVREARLDLDERRVTPQPDPVGTAHPLHRVEVAVPDDDLLVARTLDVRLDRQERGGPVMLRPVELDATRHPWTREADEGRLDDVVAVEEVVVAGLVVADVDAPTQFGQQHEPDPAVLEVNRAPLAGRASRRDAVDERNRVDPAARALVHPAVEEERIPVGLSRFVGLDEEWGLPAGDAACLETLALAAGRLGKFDTGVLGAHVVNGRRTASARQ
jgi:hypothetical protein